MSVKKKDLSIKGQLQRSSEVKTVSFICHIFFIWYLGRKRGDVHVLKVIPGQKQTFLLFLNNEHIASFFYDI